MVCAPRCTSSPSGYDQYSEAWDTSYWSSVPMGGKQDALGPQTYTLQATAAFPSCPALQESVHFFHTFKQKAPSKFFFGLRVEALIKPPRAAAAVVFYSRGLSLQGGLRLCGPSDLLGARGRPDRQSTLVIL